jgi:hypothetical protein
MARQDTQKTAEYRTMYDYQKRFDLTLATAFELEERGNTRFDFYDRIGKAVNELGRTIFLPHREISLDWPPEKIHDIATEIVVPTSDLVIAYAGIPSSAGGVMVGAAYQNNVPVIYFYEKGREGNLSDICFRADVWALIEFETDEEAISRLREQIKYYF